MVMLLEVYLLEKLRRREIRCLDNIAHKMPKNKVRYLMGVGTPEDIVEAVITRG